MRCRHCDVRFHKAETIPPYRASCPQCARLAAPLLVTKQGDGLSGFRELMIRQNAGEGHRKLLETRTLHFIVFFDDEYRIVGFDLEDCDYTHLYQWRRGKRPVFYGVTNVGKNYHNRDEVYLNGRFPAAQVAAELEACGGNLQDDVRELLLDGINAHA